MNTLSISDQRALLELILISTFIFSVFGFIFLNFVYRLLDRYVFKKLRLPKKIKTKNGYLFRSYSGVYVPQFELNDANADYIHRNKQRSIKLLEYRLQRLKSHE